MRNSECGIRNAELENTESENDPGYPLIEMMASQLRCYSAFRIHLIPQSAFRIPHSSYSAFRIPHLQEPSACRCHGDAASSFSLALDTHCCSQHRQAWNLFFPFSAGGKAHNDKNSLSQFDGLRQTNVNAACADVVEHRVRMECLSAQPDSANLGRKRYVDPLVLAALSILASIRAGF